MSLPPHALEIVRHYRTCELTTFSKRGVPVTWPVTARHLADGRFLLTTSIGLPQKAFNIRRNPKVSLLFSEPKASSIAQPGALLVRGDATAEDRIVTDMTSDPDLEALLTEQIFARQPASQMMSSWIGKLLMKPYYMRILIYVTPRRIDYWPTRDFATAPQRIEVSHVG